jgi:hypothetical protein
VSGDGDEHSVQVKIGHHLRHPYSFSRIKTRHPKDEPLCLIVKVWGRPALPQPNVRICFKLNALPEILQNLRRYSVILSEFQKPTEKHKKPSQNRMFRLNPLIFDILLKVGVEVFYTCNDIKRLESVVS